MMISPESYIDELRDKSYEELLKERDELIDSIRDFEKNKGGDRTKWICPTPEVIYQWNLECICGICELVLKKYNEEIDEEEELE